MEKNKKLIQNLVKFGFKASDVASVKIFDTDFVLLLKNGKKVTLKDGAMLAMTQPDLPIHFEDDEIEVGKILKWVGQVDLSGVFNTVQNTSNPDAPTDTDDKAPKANNSNTTTANTVTSTTTDSAAAVTSSIETAIKPLNDSILQLQQQIEQFRQQLNANNANSTQVATGAPPAGTPPAVLEKSAESGVPPTQAPAVASNNSGQPPAAVAEKAPSNTPVNTAASTSTPPAPDTTAAANQPAAVGVTPVAIAAKEAGFLSSISPQWGALGALGALAAGGAGGGGGTAAASSIVSSTVVGGTVTLGPVRQGNDLVVTAYDAQGTRLANASVDSNGNFSISLGKIYVGSLIISVASQGSEPDYTDETTTSPTNLSTTLYSVSTVISGQLTKTMHVNPATQLAANDLLDTSSGLPVLKSTVTAKIIADKNQATSKLIGLTDSDITTAVAIPTIDTSGKSNANANTLGKFLATISQIENTTGKTTVLVISELSQQVASSSVTKIDNTVVEKTTHQLTAPTFTSKSTASVDENADSQTIVYQASASTTVGFAYSLKSGGDSSLLSIDTVTGAVRLLNPADFETKSSYTFTVVASLTDGSKLYSEQAVTLSALDKNDNAPAFTSPATMDLLTTDINNGVVYQAQTSDLDGTAATRLVSFSLKTGLSDDAGMLNINPTTGNVSLKGQLDLSLKSTYSFTVVATNTASDATLIAEQAVTLSLSSAVNQKPITSSNTINVDNSNYYFSESDFNFLDNDTNPTLSQFQKIKITKLPTKGLLEYSADGNNWTAVVANQDIATQEITNNHFRYSPQSNTNSTISNYASFAFKVSDGYAWSDGFTAITFSLSPVTPVFSSDFSSNVEENSDLSTVIYQAEASASNSDAVVTYSLKTKSVSTDYKFLSIDPGTGEVKLRSTDSLTNASLPNDGMADYETKTSYSFTVVATLKLDGSTSTAEQAVVVTVDDVNDNAPEFTSAADIPNLQMSFGSKAIYTATTKDADKIAANRQVFYRLREDSDDDASFLSIDPVTGVVSLNSTAPSLDLKSSYTFTVIAFNNAETGDLSTEQTVTIDNLSAPNSPPTSKDRGVVVDGSDFFLTQSYFDFYDGDTTFNQFVKIKIISLPLNGLLQYWVEDTASWEDVLLNQDILTTELDLRHLRFSPQASASDSNYSSFRYKVSDGSLWSEQPNSISINLNLLSPVFASPNNPFIEENTAIERPIYKANATVIKGDISYSLKQTGDYSLLDIDSQTGEVTLRSTDSESGEDIANGGLADYEAKTSYNFTVVATVTFDSGTTSTNEQAVTVAVNDVNDNAPVFTSSAKMQGSEVNADTNVFYTATTEDADGTAANRKLSYSLRPSDDSKYLAINPTTGEVSLNNTAPDLSAKSSYTFTVRATNDNLYTDQRITATQLKPSNYRPTSGNNSITVKDAYYYFDLKDFPYSDLGDSATAIDAIRVVSMPVNGRLEYFYSDDSGYANWVVVQDQKKISASDMDNRSFRYNPAATASSNNYGSFTFQVYDGSLWSLSTNTMTINVNQPRPVFDTPNSDSVTENADPGSPIHITVASVSSIDFPNIIYSLKASGDYELLDCNTYDGSVMLKNSADYETKRSYTFTIVATLTLEDSTSSSEQTVTVSVKDVNDCPPVFTDGDTVTIASYTMGNTSKAIYTTNTTDADGTAANKIVSYRLKNPGTGDAVYLSIDSVSGVVSLKDSAPDLLDKSSYTFTVIADNASDTTTLSAEQKVIIQNLTVLNNRPSSQDTTLTVNGDFYYLSKDDFFFVDVDTDPNYNTLQKIKINSTPNKGLLQYSSDGTNWTDVSANQEITVAELANKHLRYSAQATGSNSNYGFFTYKVSDGYLWSETANAVKFNVSLLSPSFTSGSSSSINENTVNDTLIYTAAASADSGTVSYSLKTTGDASSFSIDRVTGAVTLRTGADYETKPSYTFTVVATLNQNGSTSSSEQTVNLAVTDVNDKPPVFTDGTNVTVPSYTLDTGSNAIHKAVTTDADGTVTNQQVKYSLKNPTSGDAVYLNIDINTGVVSLNDLAPSVTIKSSYSFTVVASNNTSTGNLSAEQTVTVNNLTATNYRPTTSNSSIQIDDSGTYVFKTADFKFLDADTDAAKNTFTKIKITSLPATGNLTLNGNYIIQGQEINVADIANIKYIYTQNLNTTSFASFSYQVSDGLLYSLSSGTSTFNVVVANRAPTYSASLQSQNMLEDSTVLNTVTAGTASASRTYLLSDLERDSIYVDFNYLISNGWSQNGTIVSKTGKYGTVSFDANITDRIFATYQLNNTLALTQALKTTDTVSEDPFNVQVKDSNGAPTLVPLQFGNIKGAKDVTINNPAGISLNFAETVNQFDIFTAQTGALIYTDDTYADLSLTVAGATTLTGSAVLEGKYNLKYTTTYGDFYLVSSGANAGQYKFVSNDQAINKTTPTDAMTRTANGGYDYKVSFNVSVSASGVSSVNTPVNINITSALDTPQLSPNISSPVYANRIQNLTLVPSVFGINNLNNVAESNLKISISNLIGFTPASGRDTYLNTNYFYFNDRSNITNTSDGSASGITETSVVTFSAITALSTAAINAGTRNTVTVGGLTLTIGGNGAASASALANAFASYVAGTSPSAPTNSLGTFSGSIAGFSSGTATGSSASAAVTFTSATATANVTDLTVTGTGVSIKTTQGIAPNSNESATLTFFDMSAGDAVTVSNLTFTANQPVSAAQVADLFRGKASNTTPTSLLGSFTGNLVLWNSSSDANTGNSQVTFKSNATADISPIIYKNKISNFTLADVTAGRVSFYDGNESTAPSFTTTVTDTVNARTSSPVTTTSTFAAAGSIPMSYNGQNLKAGNLIYGDASGGGSASSLWSNNFSDPGTNGSAGADTLAGTAFEDIIFGDGSGGGAGGTNSNRVGRPGFGGGAADSISGADGNDIVFGDGFSGSFAGSILPQFGGLTDVYIAAVVGTNGGYGGGGGGATKAANPFFSSAGLGGIGGGDGYGTASRPLLATDINSGSDLRGSPSTVGVSRVSPNTSAGGGGGGVSATGADDTSAVTAGLDPAIYNKVMTDLSNTSSDIYKQVMGAGDDTLDGGAGNDWIMGGFGNDLIIGGSGNDTMWGRGGANTSSQHNTSNVNGTASAPETVELKFVTGDVLSQGNTLSYGGLTITALSDLNAVDLATALSNISVGGSGTSTGRYTISGNLLSGWSSSTYSTTNSDFINKFTYTMTFKNNVNGNVDVTSSSLQAAITTYNMSDNDTFQWNAGDASAGSVSTDTIKDFNAWNNTNLKGDKIDISNLLRSLGYQAGSSTLSDWVSFTPASGSTAARIDIDTGAGTTVVQSIVLENATMNGYTTLDDLLNNRVLIT